MFIYIGPMGGREYTHTSAHTYIYIYIPLQAAWSSRIAAISNATNRVICCEMCRQEKLQTGLWFVRRLLVAGIIVRGWVLWFIFVIEFWDQSWDEYLLSSRLIYFSFKSCDLFLNLVLATSTQVSSCVVWFCDLMLWFGFVVDFCELFSVI